MADMWGAPVGISAAIADEQRVAQTQQIQLQSQRTDLMNQQLGAELQDQQQMKQLLSTLGKEPGTPTELLDKVGTQALRGGMLAQAEKAFTTAAVLQQKGAVALEQTAKAEEVQLKADQKKIDQFVSLAQAFPDTPQGWKALTTSYMANNPQLTALEQQIMAIPWAPGLQQKLSTAFMTASQRATMNYQAQNAEARAVAATARSGVIEAQLELSRERLALAKESEVRKAKTGERPAGSPTALERGDAADTIKAERKAAGLPELDPEVEVVFATDIASEARQIMRSENVDWGDALAEAYANNEDRVKVTPGRLPFKAFATTTLSPKSGGRAPAAGEVTANKQPDISQAAYSKLKAGDRFWWGGKQIVKGAR